MSKGRGYRIESQLTGLELRKVKAFGVFGSVLRITSVRVSWLDSAGLPKGSKIDIFLKEVYSKTNQNIWILLM